jgi:hypothetical protein
MGAREQRMHPDQGIGVFRPTRRRAGLIALAAVLAALRPARAQVEVRVLLRVTISPEDSEIITSDLKRLRLAEPAEFVFVKTDAQAFDQLYPGDVVQALTRLRIMVLSAARRVFGEMPSAAVLRGDGTAEFVARINADCKVLGMTLQSHVLRYEPVPPL